MEDFFRKRGFSLSATHWFRSQHPPPLENVDFLIIMGGPMGVYDEDQHPWLIEEREYIRKAIEAGKKVLGICLGAQLIASVMGANISRNAYKEIGWFPIHRTSDALSCQLGKLWPETIKVFHWHGDTFSLPKGAHWLASSEACPHQAFVLEDRIFGFQFHLETTPESAENLIAHCSNEFDDSPYVQSIDKLRTNSSHFTTIDALMEVVLNSILEV